MDSQQADDPAGNGMSLRARDRPAAITNTGVL
jgi:hypothetical protein